MLFVEHEEIGAPDSTAEYNLMGILTSLQLMEPLQIALIVSSGCMSGYLRLSLLLRACGVQILFRQSMPSEGMVKLTNEDIKWLVMRVNSGFFIVVYKV